MVRFSHRSISFHHQTVNILQRYVQGKSLNRPKRIKFRLYSRGEEEEEEEEENFSM